MRQQPFTDYAASNLLVNDAGIVVAYEWETTQSLAAAGFVPYGTAFPAPHVDVQVNGRFGALELSAPAAAAASMSGVVVPIEIPVNTDPEADSFAARVLYGRFQLLEQGLLGQETTNLGMILAPDTTGVGTFMHVGVELPAGNANPEAMVLSGNVGDGIIQAPGTLARAEWSHAFYTRMVVFAVDDAGVATRVLCHVSRDGIGWMLLGEKELLGELTHFGAAMQGASSWLCDWLRVYEYEYADGGDIVLPTNPIPPTGARLWNRLG